MFKRLAICSKVGASRPDFSRVTMLKKRRWLASNRQWKEAWTPEKTVLETKFREVEISVATETDELGDPL